MKTYCLRCFLLPLFIIFSFQLRAQVHFVDSNATGLGNGTSWLNAFPRLEMALSVALPGDSVWVAAGTYRPTTTTNRAATFDVPGGVTVIGGFSGTESSACEANPTVHLTILTGDIGVLGDSSDNSYHVVYVDTPTQDVTLDGFTIRDGYANGTGNNRDGGGMLVIQVTHLPKLTVRNCRFTNNFALGLGTGVRLHQSTSEFIDCRIDHNYSSPLTTSNPSGFYALGEKLTITRCEFTDHILYGGAGAGLLLVGVELFMNECLISNNQTAAIVGGSGGGMYARYAMVWIQNTIFRDNTSENGGGATFEDCRLSIRNSTFLNNVTVGPSPSYGGGGVLLKDCTQLGFRNRIENCKFLGNNSHLDGGGVHADWSLLNLRNCLFSGNSGGGRGGGASLVNGTSDSSRVYNCTFVGNQSGNGQGGGLYTQGTFVRPRVSNCIFESNVPNAIADYPTAANPVDVQYSIVAGGFPGVGNQNVSAMLRDPNGADNTMGTLDDDARLLLGSPAVNKSNPDTTGLLLPGWDLAFSPRLQMDTLDVGAYEGIGCIAFPVPVYAGPDTMACQESPIQLMADAPVWGIGTWTLLAGCGWLTDNHDPHAFLHLDGGGPVLLEWRIDYCDSSFADTVSVGLRPIVNPFSIATSGPITFCDGTSLTLTAPANQGTYLWSNGGATNFISATSTGNYSVTITNTSGCTASNSITVSTIPKPAIPVIQPTGPISLCNGQTTVLAANIGYAGYLWSNGASTQQIVVSQTGSYYVRGIGSNGCQSDTSMHVAVYVLPLPPQPVVSSTGTSPFCFGDSIQLSAPIGYPQYQWSNGHNGSTLSVQNSGSYTVVVTGSNGCNSMPSAVFQATERPAYQPNIAASGALTFCAGDSLRILGTLGQNSYLWSTGDTTSSIVVFLPDSIFLQVVDAYGCTSLNSSVLVVDTFALPAIPAISPASDTAFCAGQNITLYGPAGMAVYAWSNGASGASIVVNNSGTYTLSVQNADGCWRFSDDTVAVTQWANPAAPALVIEADPPLCSGDSVLIWVAGQWDGYAWSSSGAGDSIWVTASGNYSVIVTDNHGCKSPPSLPATVVIGAIPQAPVIQFSGGVGNAICQGDTMQLLTGGGLPSYQWSDLQVGSSIRVTDSGCWTVQGWDASGCPSRVSDTACVSVHPLPIAPKIAVDTSACIGSSISLSGPAGYSAYHWSDGQTQQEIEIQQEGSYWLQVVDQQGCKSPRSDSASIAFYPVTNSLEDGTYLYPNPNQAVFKIHFPSTVDERLTLTLYNAVGQRLWNQEVLLKDCQPLDYPVDVTGLADGPYMMVVVGRKARYSKTFTVQK